jgi:Xaa-Pro aminopeptidase
MKSDLDQLMEKHDLDAIFITGPAQHNPPMGYLTGPIHMTGGDLIKKRGSDPILFYNPMERDEAAKSGYTTKNLAEYRFDELLKISNGNILQATILRYEKMLTEFGFSSGRIGIYGKMDVGSAFEIFSGIQQKLPELEFVGQLGDSLMLQAMSTKDADEVDRIRAMGVITTSVVTKVADFLTSHKSKNGILVNSEGVPIVVGDVKKKINLWLAEAGVENPEGTIFAIGRDAGVPHSSGNPKDILNLGQTIVFDIFPSEAGGGYVYDFTRTWCLGYAPDEVMDIYEDVLEVYQTIESELEVDALCNTLQLRTIPKPRKDTYTAWDMALDYISTNIHVSVQMSRKTAWHQDPSSLLSLVYTILSGEWGFAWRILFGSGRMAKWRSWLTIHSTLFCR